MPLHDQVAPFTQGSEASFDPLTMRDIVRNALRTVSKILRNSLLNATVSWLLAFLISKGNFVGGLNAEQQPYAEFVAVKITWFYVFFWALTLTQSAFRLLPETFASKSHESTLSVFQVYSKLVRPMLPYAVVVTVLSVAGGVGIACLPPASRKFKADLHWTLFCTSFVMTLTGTYANHIFRFETVRGRTQSITRLRQAEQDKDMAAIARLSSLNSPRPPAHSQFLRSFIQNLPFVASALLAAAYVHIVDYIPIRTQWVFVVFALCSLVLKILIQELAKQYLLKMAATPSMRSMAVIVAAPTILVDTQLRTALLCHSNVSSTLVSSVVLAVVEISLRAVKTRHVRHHLQRASSRHPRSIIAVVPENRPDPKSSAEQHRDDIVMKPLSLTPPASSSDFPEQKLLSLHTAEVYADMCAEYIAMGSSYSILYFFGSNPKFHLGNADTAAFINDGYLVTIALQLGIEMVVDLVATSLEISMGVDFEVFNRDDTFLALFMIGIATLNVHISSGVYLKE